MLRGSEGGANLVFMLCKSDYEVADGGDLFSFFGYQLPFVEPMAPRI